MAEVLVLVDHVDGEVKKVTYELLTAERRIGEPPEGDKTSVIEDEAATVMTPAGHRGEFCDPLFG